MSASLDKQIEKIVAEHRTREAERRAQEDADGTAGYHRRARMLITPEALLTLGMSRYTVISSELPDDAHIINSGYDLERNCFVLILESEFFAPVREGDLLPDVAPPTIKRID